MQSLNDGKKYIELIATTNMGNGSTYLYNLNGEILLQAKSFDSHEEMLEYVDYHKIKQFSTRIFSGEQISRIYENNILQADY